MDHRDRLRILNDGNELEQKVKPMRKNISMAIYAYIFAGMLSGAMLTTNFFEVSYLVSFSLGLGSVIPAFIGFRFHRRVDRELKRTEGAEDPVCDENPGNGGCWPTKDGWVCLEHPGGRFTVVTEGIKK